MLFNSYVFILLFFPLTVIFYFLICKFISKTASHWFLVAMSLLFYGYFHWEYLLIIISSVLINYLFSIILMRSRHKLVLLLGILFNVALIGYYKYLTFILTNISILIDKDFFIPNILMPLGISFFTFQQISYLVDTYRGETTAYSFNEYVLFVTFFPQLVAGPIVLHNELIPQFHSNESSHFSWDNLQEGLYTFAIGLAKKVLLADTLSRGVDWAYSNIHEISGLTGIIVAISYSFQLYFDFSGYCDMAYGIAKCFNINLPQNFNSPYKATSITDFWSRWHITLTRFLTQYIYIPLGGNRKGKIRTYLNIMVVFLVSGIWHGANWTFIIWGVIHGIASVIYRLIKPLYDIIPKFLGIIFTFSFVTVAWIFFRADSITDAFFLISNIFTSKFGASFFEVSRSFCECYNILELTYVEEHIPILAKILSSHYWINASIVLLISSLLVFALPEKFKKHCKKSGISAVITVVLLVWCVISLNGVSTFLYFNF